MVLACSREWRRLKVGEEQAEARSQPTSLGSSAQVNPSTPPEKHTGGSPSHSCAMHTITSAPLSPQCCF